MTNDKLVGFFIHKLDILATIPQKRILVVNRSPIFKPAISINRWRLIIILSGNRLHRFANGKKVVTTNLTAGDILLVEPFGGVWSEEDQTYDMLSIVRNPTSIRFVSKERQKGILNSNKPDAVLHGGISQLKCFQLLLEALMQALNQEMPPDVTSLLKFIWEECRAAVHSTTSTPQAGPQYLLEQVLAFIGESLQNDISCSHVASQFGISANYVAQLFVRNMPCTFSEYVRDQRLELAQQLLKHSEMNIGEIADYCGYKQANYFIKVYKKQYGYTPLTYRAHRE